MSCIGLVDAIAKQLTSSLNGVQVAWSYFVAILVLLLGFSLAREKGDARRVLLGFRTRRLALQIIRACCLVAALSLLFYSLSYLELAVATVVSFTAPLFVVALASPLLGEQVSTQRWLAVCLGLCGAVIVARPGAGVFGWAALLPLVSALFFSLFHLITRKLHNTETAVATLFYTFFIGSLILSAAMPAVWRSMSAADIALSALNGFLGIVAHGALVRSLSLADASMLAPLNYLRLIWAIGLGFLLFGEVPDGFTLLGGAIIAGSGLYVVYSASRAVDG